MTLYYTPLLEDLKDAWVEHVAQTYPEEEATAQFYRAMDEFGNEMYEDGYSEGYSYGLGDAG